MIERIRKAAGRHSRWFKGIGIGDDCALLRVGAGQELLITTDFSLEGIHFRREWHPAASVGHRCAARGLSDIAAMGGEPLAIFLSLAVPKQLPQKWVDDFVQGLLSLARPFGATLAGGDTAQSPGPILADIVVVGRVEAGSAVLRSGARPGDSIYVTGELGASAATLDLLLSGRKRRLAPKSYARHFFPQPRVRVGQILREKRLASAMIDVSDGLSTDLTHLCEESGVGAELRAEAVPLAVVDKKKVRLRFALHGGDDYELLFTAPSKKRVPERITGVRITNIGTIRQGNEVWLKDMSERKILKPEGWEHFAGR